MLKILYFAGIRERLNVDSEQIELPAEIGDVRSLLELLQARGGVWSEVLGDPGRYRVAVDQAMARLDSKLAGASEVAIFPPVTGG